MWQLYGWVGKQGFPGSYLALNSIKGFDLSAIPLIYNMEVSHNTTTDLLYAPALPFLISSCAQECFVKIFTRTLFRHYANPELWQMYVRDYRHIHISNSDWQWTHIGSFACFLKHACTHIPYCSHTCTHKIRGVRACVYVCVLLPQTH